MSISNFLFMLMLTTTFVVLGICDYYRKVDVIFCYDKEKIIYANYDYFPLRKSYKMKYKCKSKRLNHYKFYRLKQIVEKNSPR